MEKAWNAIKYPNYMPQDAAVQNEGEMIDVEEIIVNKYCGMLN
jgi:hypothetical protein